MKRVITYITTALLLIGCTAPQAKYQYTEGYELHTPYHIKYNHTKPLHNEIKNLLQEYYHSVNAFDSTSIISHVNRNIPIELDTIFVNMFNKAIEVSNATDGLFDITCAPLINLWGFGFKSGQTVTEESIEQAKKLVGYQKVRIENNHIVKENPDMLINLSALGDGYSCDLIARLFDRHGIQDYCIEIGGEIVAKGKNPNGNNWRIGVIEPIEGSTTADQVINRVVELTDGRGLATSGDYRNFHEVNGKKVGHQINPKTGYPAGSDIVSATIIAKDGITADGFATAFMVMGSERVKKYVESDTTLDYFLIIKTSDSTVTTMHRLR